MSEPVFGAAGLAAVAAQLRQALDRSGMLEIVAAVDRIWEGIDLSGIAALSRTIAASPLSQAMEGFGDQTRETFQRLASLMPRSPVLGAQEWPSLGIAFWGSAPDPAPRVRIAKAGDYAELVRARRRAGVDYLAGEVVRRLRTESALPEAAPAPVPVPASAPRLRVPLETVFAELLQEYQRDGVVRGPGDVLEHLRRRWWPTLTNNRFKQVIWPAFKLRATAAGFKTRAPGERKTEAE